MDVRPASTLKQKKEIHMRAGLIRQFGPPRVIVVADVPQPTPSKGEVLVRISAAGVGPWDALVREGESATAPTVPLILGSDLSGVVEQIGAGVSNFKPGDEVFGVANKQFTGGYAEFAAAPAGTVARKPAKLEFSAAASAPVVAVTAWQMLFEYGHAMPGQKVLVHGAAGGVGSYAVQLAKNAGLHVIATASARDAEYVRSLGAEKVLDYRTKRFEDGLTAVDIVIDTQGGEVRERSMSVLSPTGILVSAHSPIPEDIARRYGSRAVFFIVDVTTVRLNKIRDLFDAGKLRADVGTVLPLDQAQAAHEMIAGAPHNRGKIVLKIAP
jgi:NADPH:quinone reductase-like Zn-dependent oxidoreductase